MNGDRTSPHLQILVRASHPQLLTGLNQWLQLGLISESQVQRLSQQHLTCRLPTPSVQVSPENSLQPSLVKSNTRTRDKTAENAPQTPNLPRQPSLAKRWFQSFKNEISVRWLLFLGVFLTIVSSAVLAATQWNRFPAAGQYGILATYTLIFAGVGWQIQRDERLQLTAKTLQAIALLLIPVNFWAMDALVLAASPLGWIVGAIAVFCLGAIAFIFSRSFFTFSPLALGIFAAGSVLHWGWQIPIIPWISTYSLAIATAIFLRYFGESQHQGKGFVLFVLGLLLIRGFWIESLDAGALSLAVGIGAWVLAAEGLDSESSVLSAVYQGIGAIILLLMGGVAIASPIPWQAIAIGGLGLHFFYRRVQRYHRRGDVTFVFVIGLIVTFLIPQLLPLGMRESLIASLTNLTGYADFGNIFIAIAIFGYSFLTLGVATTFQRQDQPKLTHWTEFLALSLGGIWTGISSQDTVLRSLNLSLLAIIFIVVSQQNRSIQRLLTYLAHFFGLLAVFSIINSIFPNLSSAIWAAILLGFMVIEWLISTVKRPLTNPYWYESCWILGFVLAGGSYVLFGLNTVSEWGLLWLLTPLTLTATAKLANAQKRQYRASYSSVALIFAQLLAIAQLETSLIGLAVAIGLMIVNVRYLKRISATGLHIAFVLAFIARLAWESLDYPGLALCGAVVIAGLWGLAVVLQQKAPKYAIATEKWGIILCIGELLALTRFSSELEYNFLYFAAAIVTGVAIAGRSRKKPTEWTWLGIAATLEIALIQIVGITANNLLILIVANGILGIISLIATEIAISRDQSLNKFKTLKFLPLIYAGFGLFLRLDNFYFTAYTGLITLSFAVVAIGVSRRYSQGQILACLGLGLISVGCYELVLYPILQAPAGNIIDGLTILAGIAVAIAVLYRILAAVWQKQGRDNIFNLTPVVLTKTAHLHWLLANLILFPAIAIGATLQGFNPNPVPDSQLMPLMVAFYSILTTYAFLQSRDAHKASWVYWSVAEIVIAWLNLRLFLPSLSNLDATIALIFAIVAFILDFLPWERWGWSKQPWQNAASVLPLLILVMVFREYSIINSLGVALFYAWFAFDHDKLRWSYITVACVDWIILDSLNLSNPLPIACIAGASLLYAAQFDPKIANNRIARHQLRILGIGIICATAVVFHQETGIIPASIGLAAIFIGIGLQIRAFLYTGTITFLLTAFYQLIVLIDRYATSKWIVGLIAGVILIAIAANFERRHEQITNTLQNWFSRLQEWQ